MPGVVHDNPKTKKLMLPHLQGRADRGGVEQSLWDPDPNCDPPYILFKGPIRTG